MGELKKVIVKMPEELIARLDDFKFEKRFNSRSEVIRFLLDWGLKQNPNKEE